MWVMVRGGRGRGTGSEGVWREKRMRVGYEGEGVEEVDDGLVGDVA